MCGACAGAQVVDLKDGVPGTLVVGFTTVNPTRALEKLKSDRLPAAAVPHLTQNKGYWAMQVRVLEFECECAAARPSINIHVIYSMYNEYTRNLLCPTLLYWTVK